MRRFDPGPRLQSFACKFNNLCRFERFQYASIGVSFSRIFASFMEFSSGFVWGGRTKTGQKISPKTPFNPPPNTRHECVSQSMVTVSVASSATKTGSCDDKGIERVEALMSEFGETLMSLGSAVHPNVCHCSSPCGVLASSSGRIASSRSSYPLRPDGHICRPTNTGACARSSCTAN